MKIRALIIDSTRKEIREEYIENKLSSLQLIVGANIELANCITGNDVFVDEEGLLRSFEDGGSLPGFTTNKAWQDFAGNGVIVKSDSNGNTIGTDLSLADAKTLIKFINITQETLNRMGL